MGAIGLIHPLTHRPQEGLCALYGKDVLYFVLSSEIVFIRVILVLQC